MYNSILFSALEDYILKVKNVSGSKWIITGDVDEAACRKMDLHANIVEHSENVTASEKHMFAEICICTNGSLAMGMGDHIVDVREGEACIIFPGVLHKELPKKNTGYLAIWICINLNTIALHLSGKSRVEDNFYTLDGKTVKTGVEYNKVFTVINNEINEKNILCEEIIKMDFIRFLISVLREMKRPNAQKQENRTWKEGVVSQIQAYIEKNYCKRIRLGDISQELSISSNYINSIFKSVTGETIIHYAEDFKINKSKKLLGDYERSINSIAFELGYYDQYHFSKIFKKETGMTPTQFRKQIR